MRKIIAFVAVAAAFLGLSQPSRAADYTIDLSHAHILFMVNHLGFSRMIGLFTDFGGTLSFDPANVAASKLDVTIKADSLQTQYAQRDADLKGESWFDVTEFPTITYVGTHYTKIDASHGTVTGNLTLHGVTKPVTLHVTLNKIAPNPMSKIPSVGFSATGSLMRSDFGMKTFLPAIGDKVDFIIEIEAKQKS